MLGHDVLRRPRALRLHERGVRAVRPRERAPARHVPERDQVRGRDHRHDPRPAARRRGRPTATPVGLVTTGGTGSILPRGARLPRARAPDRAASTAPNFVKPETGAPRVRQGVPPVRRRAAARRRSTPTTTQVDVDCGRATASTSNTIAIVGSACNYGYGTIDPIERARPTSRSSAASGCTSTAASAGSSCRSARSSATTSRCSTSACPGVTSHLGRHPQVRLRASRARRCSRSATRRCATRQYFFLTDWTRRQVLLARHRRLALGRAARRDLGVDGAARPRGLPAATPRRSSRPPFAMQDAVRSHPELRIIGHADVLLQLHVATSSTSTTSTTSCGRGAGASTASSTPTRSTWRSPGRRPSRASPRRSPPTSPTRSPTPIEHQDETAGVGRDLRRRRRAA